MGESTLQIKQILSVILVASVVFCKLCLDFMAISSVAWGEEHYHQGTTEQAAAILPQRIQNSSERHGGVEFLTNFLERQQSPSAAAAARLRASSSKNKAERGQNTEKTENAVIN